MRITTREIWSIATAILTITATASHAAGVKMEEFGAWTVRTSESPFSGNQASITATVSDKAGAAVTCEKDKSKTVTIFAPTGPRPDRSFKDVRNNIPVKIAVGGDIISETWDGIVTSLGYSVSIPLTATLLARFNSAAAFIHFQVNERYEISVPLIGFPTALKRLDEVCATLHISPPPPGTGSAG